MSCPSDSLQANGDGTGRTDVADQVNEPDVNAEFKRSCGDQDFDLAIF